MFLIDDSLAFRFGALDGDATCAWKDVSGDDGDRWEFVSGRVGLAGEALLSYRLSLKRPILSAN